MLTGKEDWNFDLLVNVKLNVVQTLTRSVFFRACMINSFVR
jgi:hypothetical protein